VKSRGAVGRVKKQNGARSVKHGGFRSQPAPVLIEETFGLGAT